MTYSTQKFAEDLKRQVQTELLNAVRRSLEKPAGRTPSPDLVERSEWYNSLPEEERAKVLDVARWSADLAVFGVLNVLDGSDVLSDELDGCELRLSVIDGDNESLLASSVEYRGIHEFYW